jgi:hypothetical protein
MGAWFHDVGRSLWLEDAAHRARSGIFQLATSGASKRIPHLGEEISAGWQARILVAKAGQKEAGSTPSVGSWGNDGSAVLGDGFDVNHLTVDVIRIVIDAAQDVVGSARNHPGGGGSRKGIHVGSGVPWVERSTGIEGATGIGDATGVAHTAGIGGSAGVVQSSGTAGVGGPVSRGGCGGVDEEGCGKGREEEKRDARSFHDVILIGV